MTLPDPGGLLDAAGFDPARSVLTRRQAEVLALRETGASQAEIAEYLGTSRANVSSVESSARDNIEKARETVTVAAALSAPVQVTVEAGTVLGDVPEAVLAACEDAGIGLARPTAELVGLVEDAASDAVEGGVVRRDLTLVVTNDGRVRVTG